MPDDKDKIKSLRALSLSELHPVKYRLAQLRALADQLKSVTLGDKKDPLADRPSIPKIHSLYPEEHRNPNMDIAREFHSFAPEISLEELLDAQMEWQRRRNGR